MSGHEWGTDRDAATGRGDVHAVWRAISVRPVPAWRTALLVRAVCQHTTTNTVNSLTAFKSLKQESQKDIYRQQCG